MRRNATVPYSNYSMWGNERCPGLDPGSNKRCLIIACGEMKGVQDTTCLTPLRVRIIACGEMKGVQDAEVKMIKNFGDYSMWGNERCPGHNIVVKCDGLDYSMWGNERCPGLKVKELRSRIIIACGEMKGVQDGLPVRMHRHRIIACGEMKGVQDGWM